LIHDVRQDYDKYYKTVIPNLIGENDTKTSILHFVIPACEPESPWNLFVNIPYVYLPSPRAGCFRDGRRCSARVKHREKAHCAGAKIRNLN